MPPTSPVFGYPLAGMPLWTSASNQISTCSAGDSVQWPAVRKIVDEISVPVHRQSGEPLAVWATMSPT